MTSQPRTRICFARDKTIKVRYSTITAARIEAKTTDQVHILEPNLVDRLPYYTRIVEYPTISLSSGTDSHADQ